MQNENCNFRKGPGTRCEKMAHVREYPHESSCGRPSSRTNFSFRDRTFVRWIQWFSWFRTVVQLVLSVQLYLPAFFFTIEIWTSVMFSWSTFGLWWVACRMAQFFFEPGATVDGHRFSSNWQWTWFCVCGLEEQRTNSSSSMSPSSWESSRRREKCENLPPPPNKKPPQRADSKQCKLRGEVARQTGQNFTHHLPPLPWSTVRSKRTFCLQNDATVRRIVTTFMCPQTQFHENLHTLCKTSLLWRYNVTPLSCPRKWGNELSGFATKRTSFSDSFWNWGGGYTATDFFQHST